MKRKSNLLALLGLLLAATSLHALTPDDWQYRQSLETDKAGPQKFSLPLATLDAAQPDRRDLRIIDATGKETPYLLLQPTAITGKRFAPTKFKVELIDSATIITLETGTNQPLDFVELETGARSFLKPVQIELSADGENWQPLAGNVPIFRQDGAAKTIISLEQRNAAYVRLNLSDERSRPIVVTSATLESATERPALTEPFAPRIVRTEEFTGETVLTLDLGAAHLSLSSLEFLTVDSLFARNVTVTVRELRNDQIAERTLARGAIFRVAFDAFTPVTGMQVPVGASIPTRELIVHIENGDSEPLHIREIRARHNPIHAVIAPAAAGRFEILTGNSQVAAPRYDLAALAPELSQLSLSTVRISETTTNPAYRQPDSLAGLTLEGAALNTSPWKHQRTVNTTKPGVQQIELDLHALAYTRLDLADIRLMLAGKQVPYIIERTGLSRDLIFSPVEVPTPQRPSYTRWRFQLPQSHLPFSQLILNSPTKLFTRTIRVFEVVKNQQGEPYERNLATQNWTHTPTEKPQPLYIATPDRMQTDALWIETDNGDNPPIVLARMQAFFPVIRLICKTNGTEPIDLIYGHDTATAPRYDASLITSQLLNAERRTATLGPVETVVVTSSLLQGAHGGVVLWVVLAIVVVLLLVVVAKLLPKSPKQP
ncbi:MAG: DUF3999 family protein [Verrucomicrobia bacterium]|nr:DUF3999 family protein [Verrucomicrobiota bacterium]